LVGVDSLSANNIAELAQILIHEFQYSDYEVRHLNGKREVKKLASIELDESSFPESNINESGVYIITGGGGKLGQQFAEYINRTRDVKIVLVGRSQLTQTTSEFLTILSKAEYISCNIARRDEVFGLINYVKNKYGVINGIIHAAGVICDSLIAKKTEEEILSVLPAKIYGAKYLDEATKEETLDFLIFFSSITGFFGNVGQGDYASANAYLDNFAHYRNQLTKKGARSGKTISIGWPLWKEGGMRLDVHSEQHFNSQWDIESLPLNVGVSVFEKLNKYFSGHSVILFGDTQKINQKLFSSASKETFKIEESSSPFIKEQVCLKVKVAVSDLTKLDITNINVDEELGDYGFDSILFTRLSNLLNEAYGLDLMPTVFYSFPTIAAVAEHLVDEYRLKVLSAHPSQRTYQKNETVVQSYSVKNATTRFWGDVYADILGTATREDLQDTSAQQDGIAIVGLSGRLPGSSDLNSFWENLCNNKDMITEIPTERWDWRAYYGNPLEERKRTKVKWGGFISDIDKFDPLFFGISPQEAELMDPQQRILLEEVYHALEDACISPDSLKGSNTGVFVGVSTADYSMLQSKNDGFTDQAQYPTGAFYSIHANRISYLLDLHGPSEPIDTACSSSLVAISRGIENIKNGKCDLVIAGGVNALLLPDVTLSFSQAGMLSEDGRCKTFDQSANGYVRSEGVGIVILKSLTKAILDKDHIYGVIKGVAVNHGGKANTLTSPNPNAQKNLLLAAYREAKIDPRRVSYIEAHGTGTALGDPIEIEGLRLAFKQLFQDRNLPIPHTPTCVIGSVKTNIGHLEAAAGMAGLIKVLLALKFKKIPGNVHLKQANSYLKLQGTPFQLAKETTDWHAEDEAKRVCGISSFGFGGVNAHMVIEEYRPSVKERRSRVENSPAIVLLSAKNKDRLTDLAVNLKKFLEQNVVDIYEVAYTLQVGRSAMNERLAIIVNSAEELREYLDQYIQGNTGKLFLGSTKRENMDFILEGEAGEAYIRTAIDKKLTKSLAQLWVRGISIDWKILYADADFPEKISLPVYPFARERHWIKISNEKHAGLAHMKTNNLTVGINKVPSNVEKHSDVESTIDVIRAFVILQLAELTHIDQSNFDEEEFISDYGISSIQISHLANSVNKRFSIELRPFDIQSCQTIHEILVLIQSEIKYAHSLESINVSSDLLKVELPVESATESSNLLKDNYEKNEDIAIIGVDLEISGANTLDELKGILESGTYKVSSFPQKRWEMIPSCYTQSLNPNSFKGKFLNNILAFDNQLFNISARESMLMDPQQRLLMHSVWRCIENAGYSKSEFSKRRTAVFVSINGVDYSDIVKHDPRIDEFSGRGVKRYIAANRISNYFNLLGLSETIDTACSSFFVGVSKAMDSIRNRECDQAIICGVQANLLPFTFQEQASQGILSSREQTLPFDLTSDGYVRAEGVSCIILKGKKNAEIDKDFIYAWLKGSGIAYGGRTLNITAPNVASHKAAFVRAIDNAGIHVNDIQAIEAHGTGMPLGDESEIVAFGDVFNERGRNSATKCIIGAAKSLFGHLEAASGALAVIKSIVALQQGKVTGIHGITQPNPNYNPEKFSISPKDQSLVKNADDEAIIGLHSYGIGGVSAFLVMKSANSNRPEVEGDIKNVFVLSAMSDFVLREYAEQICWYLKSSKDDLFRYEHFLASYQVNREVMKVRLAIVADNVNQLHEKLIAYLMDELVEGLYYTDLENMKVVDHQLSDSHTAIAWVTSGKVNWGIRQLSKYPYPLYPMDKRRSFWITVPAVPTVSSIIMKKEEPTTRKENQFLMLDS
jgi:acyl transferase domain-containing protein/NADP-dependent 3-hydroxy acid dehydrogenase YdfG